MALFKEISCACCGGKTNLLTRTKLSDGNYICSKCASKIPAGATTNLSHYDLNGYHNLVDYTTRVNSDLRLQFRQTHYFHGICLDAEHGLFYLDSLHKPVYCKLSNLSEFELSYEPEEVREGLLSDKVKGNIRLRMKVEFPYQYKDEVLAFNVKSSCTIHNGLFKSKAVYENPKGMDDFLQTFHRAWNGALQSAY